MTVAHHCFSGLRKNVDTVDLSDVLEEQTADIVKKAAQTSMGTDIGTADIDRIKVISISFLILADGSLLLEGNDYPIWNYRLNSVITNLLL